MKSILSPLPAEVSHLHTWILFWTPVMPDSGISMGIVKMEPKTKNDGSLLPINSNADFKTALGVCHLQYCRKSTFSLYTTRFLSKADFKPAAKRGYYVTTAEQHGSHEMGRALRNPENADSAATCIFLKCCGISETVEHVAVSELQAIHWRCKCSISYQCKRHLVKTPCFLVKVVSPEESPRCILGPMAYTSRGRYSWKTSPVKAEFYSALQAQLRFCIIFF